MKKVELIEKKKIFLNKKDKFKKNIIKFKSYYFDKL